MIDLYDTAWVEYREKPKVDLCFVRCATSVCITAGPLLLK